MNATRGAALTIEIDTLCDTPTGNVVVPQFCPGFLTTAVAFEFYNIDCTYYSEHKAAIDAAIALDVASAAGVDFDSLSDAAKVTVTCAVISNAVTGRRLSATVSGQLSVSSSFQSDNALAAADALAAPNNIVPYNLNNVASPYNTNYGITSTNPYAAPAPAPAAVKEAVKSAASLITCGFAAVVAAVALCM